MNQSPIPSGHSASDWRGRPRLSNDQVLDGLRRFAQIRGHVFRCADFQAWAEKPCTVATVITRFGSWRKALAAIGIDNARIRTCDADQLMLNLERIWHEVGRRPGAHELRWRGPFGPFPYRARWGSVRRACALLSAHKRGQISREELLLPSASDHPRVSLPPSTRWAILKRDHYRCVMCGKSPAAHPGLELEVDHIKSVARGGTNDETNLRTLCNPCNQGKKDGD
jgi:5-methylcytosine-specific restriction endonuclease McrA